MSTIYILAFLSTEALSKFFILDLIKTDFDFSGFIMMLRDRRNELYSSFEENKIIENNCTFLVNFFWFGTICVL